MLARFTVEGRPLRGIDDDEGEEDELEEVDTEAGGRDIKFEFSFN